MEADQPRVLHALPSPLCVITDRHRSRGVLPEVVQSAVRGGVRWIRVREHDLELLAYVALCRVLIDAISDARVTWSVRPSAYLLLRSAWPELRLGVHLTSADAPWQAASVDVLLGRSAHVRQNVHVAGRATVHDETLDYRLLAPVFRTACKPDAVPAGTVAISRLSGTANAAAIPAATSNAITPAITPAIASATTPPIAPVIAPVIALGGVTPQNVQQCTRAGASGVAVCGGVMESEAPDVAVAAYLRALAVD